MRKCLIHNGLHRPHFGGQFSRSAYACRQMETNDNRVSVRLEPEFLKLLNEQAVKDGKTPGARAKELLIRALTDTERTELREDLAKLQEDFVKMRGDLATLGVYLLVKVGNEKEDDAQAWVREHLAP